MAQIQIDPSRSVQLLVEGKDAKNLLIAFAQHLSLSSYVQVHDFGGGTEFRKFLAAFVTGPHFGRVRSLGIVRDAEQSADAAFKSVCGDLARVALTEPQQPAELAGESPTVGVFILPGDGRPGMLETLLCETLTNDPVALCIDAFLGCAVKRMGTPLQRPEKARAHAWIATRPDPHVSVGVAAKKAYWDLDHKALEPLRRFLTDLSGIARETPAADAAPAAVIEAAD